MERRRLTRKYVDATRSTTAASDTHGAYTVVLYSVGKNNIDVIKAIREFAGLDISEAKSIVDNCPHVIKRNLSEEEALKIKVNVEMYGANININKEYWVIDNLRVGF